MSAKIPTEVGTRNRFRAKRSLARERSEQVLSTVWQAKLDLARIERSLSKIADDLDANCSKVQSIRDDIMEYLAVRS